MTYDEWKHTYHISLNQQQEAAVQTVNGPVLLLAVPGSGKTTVLVSRLGYMLYCMDIAPESILTVTYTVAATRDMRRRFEDRFGPELSGRLEFRTINGLSQKILQYFGFITGRRPFDIAGEKARGIIKNIFHHVTGGFATENDMKSLQTGITYVKNMRLQQEEIDGMKIDVEKFPDIYRLYNEQLHQMNLIDYDDQMVYALKILESYPQVLGHFQDTFQYFCVDEAQDTSKLQHDMIQVLAGRSGNLFMVGDEDQSIYGFRAAYPQALVGFEESYPQAQVLLMERNYRSREEIVRAADKCIQRNRARHQKHMRAARPAGGKVREIPAKSRKGQFAYLLKVVESCSKRYDAAWRAGNMAQNRETAVLYRNHESALPLIDLLERRGIAFRMKNSDMAFFSHPVVNDIRDFISLALNPCDGEAFLRIYYKMGAGIRKTDAQEAVNRCDGKKPLLELLLQQEISAFTKRRCTDILVQFACMQGETAGDAIYRILHHIGYQNYIDDHNMDRGKAQILLLLGNEEKTLAAFPGRLALLQQIVSQGTQDSGTGFILSTIHSSKGLEYDSVYMIDMIEGIMPAVPEPKGDAAEEEINSYEEERRLFYVAMTRAKEGLYIFTLGEETSKFSREIFGTGKPGGQAAGQNPQAKKAFHSLDYHPYQRTGSNFAAGGKAHKIVIQPDNSIQRDNPIQDMAWEYDSGVLVEHKNFGRGVVVERDGDMAEILFEKEERTRKLSLSFVLQQKLLSLSED